MTGPYASSLRAASAIASAAIALAFAGPASADPSVWARASDPLAIPTDEALRAGMKADLRFHQMMRAGEREQNAVFVLREAKKKLAAVVAAGQKDFSVRLLYAELLRDSKENEEELAVLLKVLKDDPPAPVRADALGEIAICHALAGRREEEIRAYTDALALEPHSLARAHLLANRAEALMAMGDLQSAVDGYRAALGRLTTREMFVVASTTLFGLGVALDRIGNLEAGIESVKLARAYDENDKRLRGLGWFFSPSWDSHWYWALGAWTTGRTSRIWAVRGEAYAKAVSELELYMEEAPQDDRWIPLARVRLAAVKREQSEMMKAYDAERKRGHEDDSPPPLHHTIPH